jgi:ABC-type cobalt transport system substrate-binding protein
MYVLVVLTSVYYGVTVSQQEYRGLDACETAAAAITEIAVSMKPRFNPLSVVRTRCVPKSGEH